MNKMHILDLDTMQWKNGPDMPMARSFHGCNLVTDGQGKKKIVVMGGSPKLWGDGDHQDTVDIYDVETGVWKAGNKLPTPIGQIRNGGTVSLRNSFVLLGGRVRFLNKTEVFYDHILRYEVDEDSWTKLDARLPRTPNCPSAQWIDPDFCN